MTLTQISTAGVKDNAVTSGKIPADAIGNSELAPNAVSGTEMQNNSISTGHIVDEAVTLAKLPHGTSSNDGKFLRANNGADPTFETVSVPAGTTINNNADNRVITGSGTANTLNAESGLTFDGSQFTTSPTLFGSGNVSKTQDGVVIQRNSSSGSSEIVAGRSGGNYGQMELFVAGASGVTKRHQIDYQSNFLWYDEDGSTEMMRIDSSGRLLLGTTTEGGANADDFTVATAGNTGISIRSGTTGEGNIFFSDGTSGADEYRGILRYAHNGNAMQFFTDATERMRIDSSGDVGIGEDSPSKKLHIKTTTSDDGILLKSSTGNYFTVAGDANRDTDGQSLIRFEGKWNGTAVGRISMLAGADTTNKDDGHIAFAIADGGSMSEAMRINQYGFVKMKGDMSSHMSATGNNYHEMQADNANIQILNMKHGSSNGYGVMAQFNHGKSTHWAYRVYNYASGSDNLFVRTDGDLENINNSYGSTSDVKLKENIVDAKSQWDDIKALQVRNFNYKADENKTKFLGLVAQEAETVCPSLVKEQPDLDVDNKDLGTTTKYLKYSILYMKAIKALQEAQTRIETLETKVTALEAA